MEAKQPWMVTGSTVYRLKPTGRFRRGAAEMENEFTIQIQPATHTGATHEEAGELADGIARWLNNS